MRFGPDQIIKCPHCGFLAKKTNPLSGNTFFGATLWSDGKLEADMLPQVTVVTKCRNCRNFYWLDTAEIIGEIDFGDRSETWKEVQFVDQLTADEFAEAIEMDVGDNVKRQRYLLLQFWWSLNDKIRYVRDIKARVNAQNLIISQYEEKLQDYLPKLSALLDENRLNDQIMKAEIARAIGNFAEAIRLLENIPDECRWIADTLIPLAQQGNRWVTKLNGSPPQAVVLHH